MEPNQRSDFIDQLLYPLIHSSTLHTKLRQLFMNHRIWNFAEITRQISSQDKLEKFLPDEKDRVYVYEKVIKPAIKRMENIKWPQEEDEFIQQEPGAPKDAIYHQSQYPPPIYYGLPPHSQYPPNPPSIYYGYHHHQHPQKSSPKPPPISHGHSHSHSQAPSSRDSMSYIRQMMRDNHQQQHPHKSSPKPSPPMSHSHFHPHSRHQHAKVCVYILINFLSYFDFILST